MVSKGLDCALVDGIAYHWGSEHQGKPSYGDFYSPTGLQLVALDASEATTGIPSPGFSMSLFLQGSAPVVHHHNRQW